MAKENKTKIGAMLHAYRIMRQLNAKDFANKLGLSRVRLSQIENGKAIEAWGRYNFLEKIEQLPDLTPDIKAEIKSLSDFSIELLVAMKLLNYRAFYVDASKRKQILRDLKKLGEGF